MKLNYTTAQNILLWIHKNYALYICIQYMYVKHQIWKLLLSQSIEDMPELLASNW